MTTIKVGDKVKFTPKLRVDDFAIKIREFLLENINKEFTVIDVHSNDDVFLEEVPANVFFNPDEVEVITVENNIISDELAYLDNFHDEIYKMLIAVGKTKGYRIEELYGEDVLTNEMLSDIRDIVTEYLNRNTANTVDLSPPQKEYKLGDKVSLYYNGVPVNATIVKLGGIERTYGITSCGLLLDSNHEIVYLEESDSPTNYIIELQKRINVE